MSEHPPLITRRRFLTALGGLAGVAAVTWSVEGAGASTLPNAAPSAMSPLPSVPAAVAARGIGDIAAARSDTEVVRRLVVLCRDAWGAQQVAGQLTPHRLERLTVHHTALVLAREADAPARLREHQAFHQQDRGWADIAYHYVIDAAGIVYEGRPSGAVGDTGTDYDPTGHFLVACEGNFNEQEPSAAQYASLVDLLAWAAERYNIDPATLSGHRDWAATACPGAALYAHLTDGTLLADVRRTIANGGVAIDQRCGPAAAYIVGAIESGESFTIAELSWDHPPMR